MYIDIHSYILNVFKYSLTYLLAFNINLIKRKQSELINKNMYDYIFRIQTSYAT